MKPCPFCGAKIDADDSIFGVRYNERSKVWLVNHFCHKFTEGLDICISVYGDTKEEVIERWNGREEQTSESL
jgi:hypothetical protein